MSHEVESLETDLRRQARAEVDLADEGKPLSKADTRRSTSGSGRAGRHDGDARAGKISFRRWPEREPGT